MYAAFFAFLVIMAAGQPKALGASVCAAIGLLATLPDAASAWIILTGYMVSLVWANFRS